MPKAPRRVEMRETPGQARALCTLQRKADQAFYDSAAWQRLRRLVLSRDNGLCQECKRRGRLKTGKQIDHILPRKKRPELALVAGNLEVLCAACHNAKRREE